MESTQSKKQAQDATAVLAQRAILVMTLGTLVLTLCSAYFSMQSGRWHNTLVFASLFLVFALTNLANQFVERLKSQGKFPTGDVGHFCESVALFIPIAIAFSFMCIDTNKSLVEIAGATTSYLLLFGGGSIGLMYLMMLVFRYFKLGVPTAAAIASGKSIYESFDDDQQSIVANTLTEKGKLHAVKFMCDELKTPMKSAKLVADFLMSKNETKNS